MTTGFLDGAGEAPFLSVVVPAFREEARLPRTLAGLAGELSAAGIASWEAIVVDDGSPDRTSDVVREAAAKDPRVRLLRHEENRGKGRAVRSGVLEARGEWVLVTDADGSTPASDVARLLEASSRAGGPKTRSRAADPKARRGAPVVVGSRRARGASIGVRQPIHREALGFAFAMLLRRLLVLPAIADTQCGFKLFRRDAARALFARAREDGFVYDVEVLSLARRAGIRVAEVPVRWADDPRTQVRALPASLSMAAGLLRLALRRFEPTGARRPPVRPTP